MWKNIVQLDRLQKAILYSRTGYRRQYCTAGQATEGNIVQSDRLQKAILYSRTGYRRQYCTVGQATEGNITLCMPGNYGK